MPIPKAEEGLFCGLQTIRLTRVSNSCRRVCAFLLDLDDQVVLKSAPMAASSSLQIVWLLQASAENSLAISLVPGRPSRLLSGSMYDLHARLVNHGRKRVSFVAPRVGQNASSLCSAANGVSSLLCRHSHSRATKRGAHCFLCRLWRQGERSVSNVCLVAPWLLGSQPGIMSCLGVKDLVRVC